MRTPRIRQRFPAQHPWIQFKANHEDRQSSTDVAANSCMRRCSPPAVKPHHASMERQHGLPYAPQWTIRTSLPRSFVAATLPLNHKDKGVRRWCQFLLSFVATQSALISNSFTTVPSRTRSNSGPRPCLVSTLGLPLTRLQEHGFGCTNRI